MLNKMARYGKSVLDGQLAERNFKAIIEAAGWKCEAKTDTRSQCVHHIDFDVWANGERFSVDVKIAGIERIQLIHANDSMDICGNLKDRHQNLGKGEIGTKPFAELLAHPAVKNAPLILETPGAEEEHGSEVALLKKFRAKK